MRKTTIRLYDAMSKTPVAKIVATGKFKNVFDMLSYVEKKQESEDILGVGFLGKTNLNIEGVSGGINYGNNWEEGNNLNNVIINGKFVPLKLYMDYYANGWLLNLGVQCGNPFFHFQAYLKSIKDDEILPTMRLCARVFPTVSVMILFLEKYMGHLKCFVSETNTQLSYESVSDDYIDDLFDSLTQEERETFICETNYLNQLIDEINSAQDDEEEDDDLMDDPDEDEMSPVPIEEMRKEAIQRMNDLCFSSKIIKEFTENTKIYQSDSNGNINELDQNALIAVKRIKNNEWIPYHVIKSKVNDMDCYSVLYVSSFKNDWDHERIDDSGCIYSYVYNATISEFSDFGCIYVKSANGGLIRTQ